MTLRLIRSFGTDKSGSIAPFYAIALLALIAIAGIGFDYGRLVTMQTELQNAADQAALAAVTQLDGKPGAQARAREAARNYFANETRVASDGKGRNITIGDGGFVFFSDGEAGTPATSDTDSHAVEVTVDLREVFYALTPVVDAISSGGITASARAGLRKAACNTPSIMFCVPLGADGQAMRNFPGASDIGRELRLHLKASQADPWAPGNFGFLEIAEHADIAKSITGNANTSLGLSHPIPECAAFPLGIDSRPGTRTPEIASFDTRFGLYSGVMKDRYCSLSTGHYCPAKNVRNQHEYVFVEKKTIRQAASLPAPAQPQCGDYDTRNTNVSDALSADQKYALGFPDDTCVRQNNASCGVIGDGNWNYEAYFQSRTAGNPAYVRPSAADLGKASMSDVLRYDVYRWENAQPGTNLLGERVGTEPTTTKPLGGQMEYSFTNICAYPTPVINAPGFSGSSSIMDRRVLAVAAVDCTELRGSQIVDIVSWVDLFLLKAAGEDGFISGEIIGRARRPDGDPGYQYYGRDRAVLIR